MAEEINNTPQEENKAGCLGIGCSFLFPIVGFILYFAQKGSVSNPSAYLYGALTSIVINLLLQAIVALAGA